jgi:hypothetical protein
MANYDKKLSLHCISENIIHIIIHIIKSRSSKCDKSDVALSPQTVIKLIQLLSSDIPGGGGLSPTPPLVYGTVMC